MIKFYNIAFCAFVLLILGTGCSDFKSEHIALKDKYREAIYHMQKKEIDKGLRIMNKLASQYPNSPQPYLVLMVLKHEKFGLPKNIKELSSKEKKQLKELVFLGKKGISTFNAIILMEEKAFLLEQGFSSLALSFAAINYEYGNYKETIELYDQFYDVENEIYHPQHKYYIVQYANSLAKEGYVEDGEELY